jgi:polypeptide N-acetylgalactosaminyltransferase
LLTRIAYDRTIMAVPIIDGIDWNSFRYSPVYMAGEHHRGIFEWGFLYKESRVPQRVLSQRKHDSEPYKSPTHAGGLFAMDRKYFFEVGAYDPGLQIWGGENFELSFKIWQCGGSIEWVPCSKVGHVYRNHMPYGFGKLNPRIPIILINYMRVVEVWLDPEYQEYFYTREPTIRGYPIGNLTMQIEFKKQHKCRSFKWFVENIAFEVLEKFPPPPPNIGWGEIALRYDNICWDTRGQHPGTGPIGVYSCHHAGGNQMFRVNSQGQIAHGERCIDSHSSNTLHMAYCAVSPTGPWQYDKTTGQIKDSRSQRCCSVNSELNALQLKECEPDNRLQQFNINPIKIW